MLRSVWYEPTSVLFSGSSDMMHMHAPASARMRGGVEGLQLAIYALPVACLSILRTRRHRQRKLPKLKAIVDRYIVPESNIGAAGRRACSSSGRWMDAFLVSSRRRHIIFNALQMEAENRRHHQPKKLYLVSE